MRDSTIKIIKNTIIWLTLFLESCGVVYMDLSKSSVENQISSDLQSGIVLQIPKTHKAFINGTNIEIYQDSIIIARDVIPWNSKRSYSLDKGNYLLKTYVKYFNRKIWNTADSIQISDSQVKNISFKYPFLVTGKPKTIIK
jgi:hypothetical protein